MTGFDIYQTGCFMHEESGFEIEDISDLYEEALGYLDDWTDEEKDDVTIEFVDGDYMEEWTYRELEEYINHQYR